MKVVDPVCGMTVESTRAPAQVVDHGATIYFCSEGCRQKYLAAHPTAQG